MIWGPRKLTIPPQRRPSNVQDAISLAACDRCCGSRFFLVIVPVDMQFLRAVEQSIAAGSPKKSRPTQQKLQSLPRRRKQRGMNPQPRQKTNHALELAMFTDFSHGGIPANHRHDAFIKIAKRVSLPPRNVRQDVLGTALSRLFATEASCGSGDRPCRRYWRSLPTHKHP